MAHARGVYRELDAPKGEVVFRVYNCTGRRLSRNEVPEDMADEAMFEAVEAWLDRKCPPGHGYPCPSAEPDVMPVFDARRIRVVSRGGEPPLRPVTPLRLESSA